MSDTWSGDSTSTTSERPKEVAHYDYHDAEGNIVCRKHRYFPKSFHFSHPDPIVPRKLTWNLKGIQVPLYRLPVLLSRPEEPVYLVEGEKDADLLLTAGLVATTAPFGSKAPWQPQWIEVLQGKDVVALPDADVDGETYVSNFAQATNGNLKSLRVLHLPGLEDDTGGDVWDWFTRYEGNVDWLRQLASVCPLYTPPVPKRTVWNGADLMQEHFPVINWVVDGLVPAMSLSIWGGRPKAGKSSLLLWLAKSVCGGSPFLGVNVMQGKALLILLEDSDRRLQYRLRAQQWTESELANLTIEFTFPTYAKKGIEALRKRIRQGAYTLIGIDTLGRFAPSLDLIDYQMVTGVLGEIALVAQDAGCAIICPHHTRKGLPGVQQAIDPVADLLGSVALAGAADVVGVLYRDRSKPHATFAVTGRDIDERDIHILGSPGTFMWQTTEIIPGVDKDSLKARVLQAVDDLGGQAGITQVATFLDITKGGVQQAMNALVREGTLLQEGRYKPYKLPTGLKLPDETPSY